MNLIHFLDVIFIWCANICRNSILKKSFTKRWFLLVLTIECLLTHIGICKILCWSSDNHRENLVSENLSIGESLDWLFFDTGKMVKLNKYQSSPYIIIHTYVHTHPHAYVHPRIDLTFLDVQVETVWMVWNRDVWLLWIWIQQFNFPHLPISLIHRSSLLLCKTP